MPLRSLALALIAASAASAQPAAPLTPGTVRSGTLAADGQDRYALPLDAGTFVSGTAQQLTVDVVVTVGGRAVLAAGPSAQAGRLARAVGLDAVEVTPPAGAVWGAVALALAGGLVLGARR